MTDTPPQALQAEDEVLGAILTSPKALDVVAEILAPDDFYLRQRNGEIYRACLELNGAGDPVDATTVQRALEKTKTLDAVGGYVRLRELVALTIAPGNAGHHARIIRDAAVRRALILEGHEIASLGWAGAHDSAELLGQAEERIYQLARQRGGRSVRPFGQVVAQVVAELHEMAENPRDLLGVTTSIYELDRVTRGLRKGALTILAATTGAGKSALAGTVAINLVLPKDGAPLPVAFFSLEMGEAEITYRMLALVGRVSHDRLTRGELDTDEWARIHQAAEQLRGAPLHLESEATLTPAALRSTLRRLSARPEGLGLVVVDYLQLLTPDRASDNRTRDVAEIARTLKQTAMSLGVPVLALAQLNRNVDARPGGKPILADLKESGEIEQAADVVLLIWKNGEKGDNVREIIVAKNRHGARDVQVSVSWIGERMRFGDLQRPHLPGDMSAREAA